MISAPSTAPKIRPRPPSRLVPPMIHACDRVDLFQIVEGAHPREIRHDVLHGHQRGEHTTM